MSVATKWIKNRAIANIDEKDPSLVFYLPLHYPYSDMTGSTIYSYDRYRRSCTVFGVVWTPQGRRWDATGDDYININSALTSLAATTKGTWMAWVKLDDATPADSTGTITFGDTDGLATMQFIITTTGKIRALVYRGGAMKWDLSTDNAVLSDGVWIHITLIQNAVSPVILINGVQVTQTFATSTVKSEWFAASPGLDNGRIGCNNYNSAGNAQYIRNANVGEIVLSNRNYFIPEVQNYILATKWRY